MHMSKIKGTKASSASRTKLSDPNIGPIQENNEHLYCMTEFKTKCVKKLEYIMGTGLKCISQRNIFLVQVRLSLCKRNGTSLRCKPSAITWLYRMTDLCHVHKGSESYDTFFRKLMCWVKLCTYLSWCIVFFFLVFCELCVSPCVFVKIHTRYSFHTVCFLCSCLTCWKTNASVCMRTDNWSFDFEKWCPCWVCKTLKWQWLLMRCFLLLHRIDIFTLRRFSPWGR